MHGTALALGATGDFTVELGHERLGVHADSHCVSMISIRGYDVVVLAHEGAATDGDGLLANVEVEKSADLLGQVGAQGAFLEATDANHLTMKLDLRLIGEARVDRGRGGLAGARGLGFIFQVGGRCCFFAHRWSRVEC